MGSASIGRSQFSNRHNFLEPYVTSRWGRRKREKILFAQLSPVEEISTESKIFFRSLSKKFTPNNFTKVLTLVNLHRRRIATVCDFSQTVFEPESHENSAFYMSNSNSFNCACVGVSWSFRIKHERLSRGRADDACSCVRKTFSTLFFIRKGLREGLDSCITFVQWTLWDDIAFAIR